MKTILLCPNQASGLAVLADARPLVTLPVLGEAFICNWMNHLAAQKFKEIRVVTPDSADVISECTGNGSRWGLKVEVIHDVSDLNPEEARKRYKSPDEGDWAPAPLDVIQAQHLPGLPGHQVFASYRDWFQALPAWMPIVTATKRVGLREVEPGIWVGRRTRISRSAKLIAPCWIGDRVQIGKNALIGSNSFLEAEVVIDVGGSVESSWVGPGTFLGALTELKDSLAWGNLLINWKTGSYTLVPDSFLMASLSDQTEREEKAFLQAGAVLRKPRLASRFANVISLAQKLQS